MALFLPETELAAIRARAADWHEHTGRHIEASPSAMSGWRADVHFDRARLLEHVDALTAERDAERAIADDLAAGLLEWTRAWPEFVGAADVALLARHRAARA